MSKKSGMLNLPKRSSRRRRGSSSNSEKEVALVLDFVVAEREDFVDHAAAEIRGFAQERIAHDVEIGVAGQAEAGG